MLKHTKIAAALRLAHAPAYLSSLAFGISSLSLSLGLLATSTVQAAETPELAQVRAEMLLMKKDYESRLQLLEAKLLQLSTTNTNSATNTDINAKQTASNEVKSTVALEGLPPVSPVSIPAPVKPTLIASNGFNPSVSLILGVVIPIYLPILKATKSGAL